MRFWVGTSVSQRKRSAWGNSIASKAILALHVIDPVPF